MLLTYTTRAAFHLGNPRQEGFLQGLAIRILGLQVEQLDPGKGVVSPTPGAGPWIPSC